jgi:hypothetical protein
MKRSFNLKKREGKEFPPEKLREILSQIYSEETVDELMDRLVKKEKDNG